jgi:tetratricopeptide (TPR) repeat protein
LQLLATLAAHRMAIFDMRAIETYETLAARAAHHGLIDMQVRALLDLSYFFSLISAERCVEAAQRALQLTNGQDPILSQHTHAICTFRRLSVSDWNSQNALEFRECLAELRTRQDIAVPALSRLDDCHIRLLSGEYREARRLALEFRAEALEPGANPNLRIEYHRADALVLLSLIFLGEWGAAVKEIAAAMAQAQKNANENNILWLQVHEAWLHFHAQDFASVIRICEPPLALLREGALRAAPYQGQLRRALILTGSALAALGDHARARENFSAAASDMGRRTRFFDWYWRMPLAAGMAELSLALGDCAGARQEAERFLNMALTTPECTWQALAWETNARVALESRDKVRARECIGNAIHAVQGFEVPLAAWQVHATAATIEEELGNLEAARFQRDQSCATILRLANSLPQQEPLRKAFLSAPAVARILSRGA